MAAVVCQRHRNDLMRQAARTDPAGGEVDAVLLRTLRDHAGSSCHASHFCDWISPHWRLRCSPRRVRQLSVATGPCREGRLNQSIVHNCLPISSRVTQMKIGFTYAAPLRIATALPAMAPATMPAPISTPYSH